MKNKLIIFIITTIATGLFFVVAKNLNAQNSSLSLVKIHYQTDADFETVYDLSTSVHYYFEDTNKKESYILSQVTQTQLNRLNMLGFDISIIENNPDMKEYVIIYTPQSVSGTAFSALGEVEPIADNFTLVKIDPENLTQDPDMLVGDDTAIFTSSISQKLPKPLYKTVRVKNKYDPFIAQ